MCQYCGCHEIGPIGALMDEHTVIQNHCGDTKRCVEAGDIAGAVEQVRGLEKLLRVHNEVEERALYLSMTRFEEYAEKAGVLYDEHDDIDEIIAGVLALADAGRADEIDWGPLLAAFDVLYEHIIREDNGLFPAAAIMLETPDWQRCERVRAEAEERRSADGGDPVQRA